MIVIYAKHPIMYQVPIFRELDKLNADYLVLFGSDISLKDRYFKEINTVYSPDTPGLLIGYKYRFLKNYGIEKFHFFSRINPGIFKYIFDKKTSHILVHGYDNITSILAMIVSKCLGVKVIWRGEVIWHDQNSLTKFWLSFFLKKFVDVHLYSCAGNLHFLNKLNIHVDEKNFIRCSVDNLYFRRQYNELNQSKAGPFTIIFSGRMISRKRPLDIVLALKMLDLPDIEVIWLGDGPLMNQIIDECKLISNKCHFVGFVNQSELFKYYCKAHLAIVPSDYDPSPKVINELLNFNVISLVSNCVGTCDELTFSRDDVFNVGDVKHIAKRIEYYYHNVSLIQTDLNLFTSKTLSIYNPVQNANTILNIMGNG